MKSKMKTRKIAAKRFKVTKTGLIMRGKQNSRHLRSSKSKSQIRRYKRPAQVSHALEKAIRRMLPYA